MISNRTKFRPVFGQEATILNFPINEGYIYVAEDTGKIFIDANGKRKQIGGSGGSGGGGSANLIWANADEEEGNLVKFTDDADDDDPRFFMSISALEDGSIPDQDALVLNADGRFFRVTDNTLNENMMFAVSLIAVSGGGSGGGGGGGGTTTADLELTWTNIEQLGYTYIYDQESEIKFFPKSYTDDYVTFKITIEDLDDAGSLPIVDQIRLYNDEAYTLNAKTLPLSSNIKITVLINANSSTYNRGRGLTKEFNDIQTLVMGIEKTPGASYIPAVTPDDFGLLTLDYVPIGAKDVKENGRVVKKGVPSETLHVYIDGNEVPSLSKTIEQDFYGQVGSITIGQQNHGIHTIEFNVSTVINREEIYSDKIKFEAAWIEAGVNIPVIWVGDYEKTVINYENASIPFMIYSPADVANANHSSTVLFYKDGAQIDERDYKYSTNGWLYWDVSALYTVGVNNLTIACGLASKDIQFTVTTEGSRNLNIQPADYLLINLSSAGRSNTELKSKRDKWVDQGRNHADAILSDFNWANNGWNSPLPTSEDYNSGSYLTIANGASVTIPMGSYVVNSDKDYSFEFRFRIKNVQRYSTLVTSTAKYFYESYDQATDTWIVHTDDSKTMKEIERDANLRVHYNEWGSPADDEENVDNEINISTGVICKWLNNNDDKHGFVIGTQEAFFNSPKKLVRVRYKDDQILNLSFVISKTDHTVYIFLNGVPAGAAPLPVNARGEAVGWNITNQNLVFNSEYCDIDLYRVRMFQYGLSTPQVIHNYLSDKHDLFLYDQNQLTKIGHDNLLDYDLLVQYNTEHPDNLTMPYATWEITGGQNEILPYFKGNKRSCNINFVNPSGDKLLDDGDITEWQYYTHVPSTYAEGVEINVQGTSSQEYPRRNYKTKYKPASSWVFTHGPLEGQSVAKDHYFFIETINGQQVPTSWVGKTLEKQGADESSADYKARLATYKKLGKKWHIDTESVATNKFTWKIDYMESSGTYNTGFANLMGNLQAPLYNKHPLEDIGMSATDMRTSVYGFPVLTFHKFADGSYEYIGRYNLNLDKSSNEYYGFEVEKEQPYINQSWEEYEDVGVVDGQGNPVIDETTGKQVTEKVLKTVHEHPWISQIAECWEMKDNQGTWCSLKFPSQAAREIGFDTRRGAEGSDATKLEMTRHYEVRYNYEADPMEAILGETLGYNDSVEDKWTSVVGNNRTAHNHYLRQRFYNLERLLYWLDSTDTNLANAEHDIVDYEPVLDSVTGDVTIQTTPREYVDILTATDYTGINGATSERVTGGFMTRFTKDSVEYRLEKFKTQLQDHLDLHYCLIYFILTELLLCFDSRGKNMMLATFGPHEVGGEFIWYPIFYDIDTQLGLNNSGSYLWDYDAEVTEEGIFSTATSVLWNNLWTMFEGDIITEYRILRGQSSDNKNQNNLKYENIVGAYECNPNVFGSYAMMGVRPTIAIGLDEYYKYFATTTASGIGYYTTSGELKFEDTPTYAYCCQGDKLLTTELLLVNRLNYIDSKWMAGDYSEASLASSSITARSTLNNPQTSDIFLNLTTAEIEAAGLDATFTHGDYPVPYFDARPGFKIRPFLKQYVSYYTDQVFAPPKKFNDSSAEQDGVWTNVNEEMLIAYKEKTGLQDQIFKIPGVNYISSLGDLSTTYLTRFLVQGGKRLLDLRIGSDVPGYKHTVFDPTQVNFFASSGDSDNKPLLKQVILSNISSLRNTGYNFSGSGKLNEFRALGTGLTEVVFASGAPLGIVHLPNTITGFDVEQAANLTKILTERPVVGEMVNGEFVYKDPSEYEGLYIEDVTDLDINNIPVNSYGRPFGHALTRLSIIGGNMKYNSYILLRNLVALKNNATGANTLGINLEDVEWTPYVVVEYGEERDNNTTYYKVTDHGTYEVYNDNSTTAWAENTLNGKIYTKDETLDTSVLHDLSIFEIFMDDYDNASVMNNFTNLASSVNKTYPYISGNIYVDNTQETAVDESELTNTYKVIWPDLTIRAKYVNEAYIAKFVQKMDNGKEREVDIIRYAKGENVHPTATNEVVVKQNYNFIGWTLDASLADGVDTSLVQTLINNGVIYSADNNYAGLTALTFSAEHDVYTFYAVFAIQSFTIHFRDAVRNVEYTSYKAPYGSYLYEPEGYFTTDERDLSETERYKFLGWTRDPADWLVRNATQAKLVNLSQIISQNIDQTFYAVYIKEDCLENPTDDKYFTFNFVKGNMGSDGVYRGGIYRDDYDPSYDVYEGFAIFPRVNLSGKITLPATHVHTDGQEYPVVVIGGSSFRGFESRPTTPEEQMNGMGDTLNLPGRGYNITHIYWYGDTSQFRSIEYEAFHQAGYYGQFETQEGIEANRFREPGVSIFKYFQMPENTRYIGANAFGYTDALTPIDFSQTKVAYIGDSAFYSAFTWNQTTYDCLHFPGSLRYIGPHALEIIFQNCALNQIVTLQFGGEDDPTNLTDVMQDAIMMPWNAHISNLVAYLPTGADDTIFTLIIPSTCCLSGNTNDRMGGVTTSILNP